VCPLDPAMIADAARHAAVVTAEDGVRDGGAGSLMASAIARHAAEQGTPAPPVEVLGVPVRFIPHGKPDRILAQLGLDADGVAAAVARAAGR
jgi:1-deoxy-D-xylulose-5-phosphate synthase